jgi:membrane protein DedA with SNARE-associated domain
MIATITSSLQTAIQDHGLLAVFILMALESCGIPIPSEVIMPVAGALAAGALGGSSINAPAAVVAGAGGNLVGSLGAYGLAARFGEPFLLGPGRYVGIRRSHVDMADTWFQKRGLLTVFVGRMLPVIRTYVSFPAGMARVALGRFSVLTFAGAVPWCALLTYLGYRVGKDYDNNVSGPIAKAAIVVGVMVLGVIVAWFVRGRRTRATEGAA